MDTRKGGWTLQRTAEGWDIRVQYCVPLGDLLPGYLKLNASYAVFLILLTSAMTAIGVFPFTDHTLLGLLRQAPLIVAISVPFSLFLWPFRFGEWGPPSSDYYLRYRRANRLQTISVRRGHFDLPDGLFEAGALRTARVDPSDAFEDRETVVVDGRVVHGVRLVSWPGIPGPAARELCAAVVALESEAGESLTSAST